MAPEIKFLLTLRLKEKATADFRPANVKNSLDHALVEIVKLPKPGEIVPRAKVGQKVQGRLILQYLGPVTLEIVSRAEDFSAPPKAVKAKKAKAAKKTKAKAKKKGVKKKAKLRREVGSPYGY